MAHMKWMIAVALRICACDVSADEFPSGDVRIAYTSQGDGSAVLLVHGLHGSGAANWTLPGITAALAQSHRVIVMDCRGHGKSGKPSAAADYGLKMVDDVIALMNHLDLRQAHLVGYSMGGMIAMKTAVLHPERVRGLLLCGMGWLKQGSALESFWGNARHPCAQGFTEFGVTAAEVQALRMPAAIIVGDRDPVDRMYVVPLTQIRPDWPVTRIPGAGHINCILKPAFREAVGESLMSLERR